MEVQEWEASIEGIMYLSLIGNGLRSDWSVHDCGTVAETAAPFSSYFKSLPQIPHQSLYIYNSFSHLLKLCFGTFVLLYLSIYILSFRILLLDSRAPLHCRLLRLAYKSANSKATPPYWHEVRGTTSP